MEDLSQAYNSCSFQAWQNSEIEVAPLKEQSLAETEHYYIYNCRYIYYRDNYLLRIVPEQLNTHSQPGVSTSVSIWAYVSNDPLDGLHIIKWFL